MNEQITNGYGKIYQVTSCVLNFLLMNNVFNTPCVIKIYTSSFFSVMWNSNSNFCMKQYINSTIVCYKFQKDFNVTWCFRIFHNFVLKTKLNIFKTSKRYFYTWDNVSSVKYIRNSHVCLSAFFAWLLFIQDFSWFKIRQNKVLDMARKYM